MISSTTLCTLNLLILFASHTFAEEHPTSPDTAEPIRTNRKLSLGMAWIGMTSLQSLAVLSILVGAGRVFLTYRKLYEELKLRSELVKRRTWVSVLLLAFPIVIICITLPLLYFFYDIFVYVGIVSFVGFGIFSITQSLAFWISQLLKYTPLSLPSDCQLCGYRVKTARIFELCILPFSIAFVSTWVVYRNNEDIGWPMQCTLGVFIISWLLSTGIILSSLKQVTFIYTILVIYDIFFVYITPLFSPTLPGNTSALAAAGAHTTESGLLRSARSIASQVSVMEAVATGSAGTNGEMLPVSFRIKFQHSPSGDTQSSLLGFGDVVIPGLLCVYLAFFDSMWNTRWNRNFWASIVGYMLGCVITCVVAIEMSSGQPALLFLCPCTFGMVVLVAWIGGGRSELKRLWSGMLPLEEPDGADHMVQFSFESVARTTNNTLTTAPHFGDDHTELL